MTGILSLLIVTFLAILTQRVASTALSRTGVSRELARFQARSALTGVGFTTQEAEAITRHPVRRRIISLLMMLGSAGVITAMASLILSFIDVEEADGWVRLAVLLGGLAALWFLASSRLIERRMDEWIARALDRWTEVRVRDYTSMLHLTDEYEVIELKVDTEDWLADRPLKELNVDREGVDVLGITRTNGDYVGAPGRDAVVESGDRVLLYGKSEVLEELDVRRKGASGELEHASSVQREEARRRREEEKEQERRRVESQSR